MGLDWDLTSGGLGPRTARYAMIIDDLVVKYVEVGIRVVSHRKLIFYDEIKVEPSSGVTASGALAVLAQL